MDSIEIVIYSTKNGKRPFSEWRDALDNEVRAAVSRRLVRLRLGNLGDVKRIQNGEGIWELRIDHGPGYRIYFAKLGTQIVILLTAGNKRSQSKDIERAKKYWLEYKDSR